MGRTRIGRYILQVFSLPIGLWCLLLSPTPTPAPTQAKFLAFTIMLSFFLIIVFIHYVFTKLYVFFSVLVLFLFSNEYPQLNMLNYYSTFAKALQIHCDREKNYISFAFFIILYIVYRCMYVYCNFFVYFK